MTLADEPGGGVWTSCVQMRFNAQPEFLTRDQASQLIASMSAQLSGNGQDRNEAHADEPGMEG